MNESGLQGQKWRRLLLAGLLGGLLALCLHNGSRAFLLADQVGAGNLTRSLAPLPTDQSPVAVSLWLERAAEAPPVRDDLLSLYEAVDAKTREDPGNAAWWRSAAWIQNQLGNGPQSVGAWNHGRSLSADNDYRGAAADYHLAALPAGPRAWRKLALLMTWPLTERDRKTARALSQPAPVIEKPGVKPLMAVVAASLPGALLACSLSLFGLAALSWGVLRVGVVPRMADGWPVFGAAVVAGLVVFWFTRLTATSLWVSLLVGSFGVFRDRILHHSRRSGADDWVQFVLLGLASAVLVAGFIGWGVAARELGHLSPRVDQLAEAAPSLVQGAGMVASISIGVSLVRAYLGRVEPVVEAFGNLQHVCLRLAVTMAALTLLGTPACMAWDGAMADAMAQSSSGQVREP